MLEDWQYKSLTATVIVSSIFGIFGSLFRRTQYPQTFANPMGRLIAALIFSDLLNSLVTIFGRWPTELHNMTFCRGQAIAMYLSNLSSAFLGLGLALNAFYIVIMNGNTTTLMKYQTFYIIVSFFVPCIIAFIPLMIKFEAFYGSTDLWCWVASPSHRIMYFYSILWFMLACNVATSSYTWLSLKKSRSGPNENRAETALMRLMMGYSLAFIVAWIPGSLARLNDLYKWSPKYGFVLCQALIQPARGLLDAIAFHHATKDIIKIQSTDYRSTTTEYMDKSSSTHLATPTPCTSNNNILSLNRVVGGFYNQSLQDMEAITHSAPGLLETIFQSQMRKSNQIHPPSDLSFIHYSQNQVPEDSTSPNHLSPTSLK
ncbi:hypothetical protein HDV02_001245 [Globomyces sp. JEL0801]|nr:hypothetical protein HDV02_001245 [Globomyces sp. JEL0801]